MFPQKLLAALGRAVYAGVVPVAVEYRRGAETYLPELWAKAPWRVALTHTGLALVTLLLPPVVLRTPRLFSALPNSEKERMITTMMRSRIYLLRLIAFGVRGHALIAILRDEKARAMTTPAKTKIEQVRRAVG